MGTKKISELTPQADISVTDLLEIETAGGLSRYTTLAKVYSDMARNSVYDTSTSYDGTDTDGYTHIRIDTTSGDITYRVPAGATNINRTIKISNVKGGTNKVIITALDGAVLSNDALSAIWLPKIGDYVEFQYCAVNGFWEVINEKITCMYEFDTYAAYGTDNKIMRYANNPMAIGNFVTTNYGSYGAATGLEITIQRSGNYIVINHSQGTAAGQSQGISKNSNQLTTSVLTITTAHRRALCMNATSGTYENAEMAEYCSKGDVIRMHTDGTAGGALSKCTLLYKS